MLIATFLRMALWAICLMLGGLGVFLSIVSCRVPAAGGAALVFLATGLAINYFLTC